MRVTAATHQPGADVRDGVASALPFLEAQFDMAIAIEVYRYLSAEDITAGYREAWRVLRPGGQFFFTMVNRDALDGFWLMQRARQLTTAGGINCAHPHCEFVTPAKVEGQLRDAGFVDVKTAGRLLAPIRFAYKASPRLGEAIAQRIERMDDRVSDTKLMTRFSGHLICTATKPALG